MLDVLHHEWVRDVEMTAHLQAVTGTGLGGQMATAPTPVADEETQVRVNALVHSRLHW